MKAKGERIIDFCYMLAPCLRTTNGMSIRCVGGIVGCPHKISCHRVLTLYLQYALPSINFCRLLRHLLGCMQGQSKAEAKKKKDKSKGRGGYRQWHWGVRGCY